MNPRILIIDIETAPILANVWKIWRENIGINQIRKDTHLLSFAAKWLGEREIFYADQSHVLHIENDKGLLLAIWKLLDEADVVVVQNGDAFDIPTIRTRMISHGILPPSPFFTVDTFKEAQKHFRFTSNKLEFLATACKSRLPKYKHNRFPGFDLWTECLARNKEAWAEMKRYNIDDVYVLEDVYLKMRPWIEGHPNIGVFRDGATIVCPKCGGKVMKRGIRYTNLNRYQSYSCTKCGGYSRGRISISTTKHRANQLVN